MTIGRVRTGFVLVTVLLAVLALTGCYEIEAAENGYTGFRLDRFTGQVCHFEARPGDPKVTFDSCSK